MGIKSNFGFIYFNELLYRCMRRKYGSMKINKEMQIFVKKMLPKVNKPLLREVVKLGHQFGYIFPEEVVIRCK